MDIIIACRKWLYLLVCGGGLLCSQSGYGMTVTAEIKSGQVRWISAETSTLSNSLVPSIWETPYGLMQATDFIPGASSITSLNVNFVGPSGNNVSLEFTLEGVEYICPEMGPSSLVPVGSGGTAQVFPSSPSIVVDGVGLGNLIFPMMASRSPFTHVRPIFSFGDSDTITQAFSDANAVQGIYKAQLSIPIVYEYRNNNGVMVQHNLTIPFNVEIENKSSVLTDIVITSPTNGVITPSYYTESSVKKVRGNVRFNGRATGVFTNGLRVYLKSSDTYVMKDNAVSSPATDEIPYSVVCNACADSELVDAGVAISGMSTTGTRIEGSNVNTISFSIDVSFSDILLSTLHSGSYRGQFSLLFEPAI